MIKNWLDNEIEFLHKHYYENGPVFCAKNLARSLRSVYTKANKLGLNHKRQNGVQKRKYRMVDKNHCVTSCRKHGQTRHYIKDDRIVYCMMCKREEDRERKKNPKRIQDLRKANRKYKARKRRTKIGKYEQSLRNAMNRYKHGQIGCFRELSYSGQELCDHLESIRSFQNNRCPVCAVSYDETSCHVDHIVPISSANSKEQLLKLFDLVNLTLMCGRCNILKGKK